MCQKLNYGMKFNIDCEILNTKDYGVPQHRKRAVIKMYKKNLKWESPKKNKRNHCERCNRTFTQH